MTTPTNLAIGIWNSPLGPLMGMACDTGLRYLGFLSFSPKIPALSLRKCPDAGAPALSFLHETGRQLEEFFQGNRKEFSLTLDPQGTPFQKRVWEALMEIPCGETRSYKQQTDLLGDPLAIRAVARANGQNPLAIVIPCHRVVGADGKLTGYAGGLYRKRWLLDHEQIMVPGGQVRLF